LEKKGDEETLSRTAYVSLGNTLKPTKHQNTKNKTTGPHKGGEKQSNTNKPKKKTTTTLTQRTPRGSVIVRNMREYPWAAKVGRGRSPVVCGERRVRKSLMNQGPSPL